MPLIRCDYSPKLIDEPALRALVKVMLEQSIETFHSNRDAVSVFTKPYEAVDHSTAAAEVEVRAKIGEFEGKDRNRNEIRQEYMSRYKTALQAYCAMYNLNSPIIFTITFEDWQVAVVSSR